MPLFQKLSNTRFLVDEPEVADLQVVGDVVVENNYLGKSLCR